MYTNAQALVIFMKMILCGVVVGSCYDILTAVFSQCFSGGKGKNLPETAFAASGLIILVKALAEANGMVLRLFMLLGFLLGCQLEKRLLSNALHKLCEGVFSLCGKSLTAAAKPVKRRCERFVIDNKVFLGKIKNRLNRIKKLPKDIAISYNTYGKYFFKGSGNGGSKRNTTNEK